MGTGRRNRLGAPLLVAIGLAGCGSEPACQPPVVTAAAPLPRVGAAWMLPMTVDGVTLPMTLDTGSAFSVLDGAALAALKGHPARRLGSLILGGFDGPATTTAYELGRVDLAGGELDTAGFLYEPGLPSMGGRSGGLIGNDLLRYWDVDLDGADDAIQLELPQRCAAPVAPWRAGIRTEVALSRSEDGEYVFPARLDGAPVDAFIDTGAAITAVDRSVVPLDAATLARDREVVLVGVRGHLRAARLHRFADLSIAGRSFGPIDAVVTSGSIPALSLGANFIGHYRIALLYRAGRAFIGDRLSRHPFRGPPVPPLPVPAAASSEPVAARWSSR